MTQSSVEADLNNLAMSEEAIPLLDAVRKHIKENVEPITEEFFRLGEGRTDRQGSEKRQEPSSQGNRTKQHRYTPCIHKTTRKRKLTESRAHIFVVKL